MPRSARRCPASQEESRSSMVATGRLKRPCNCRAKRSATPVRAVALSSAWRSTPYGHQTAIPQAEAGNRVPVGTLVAGSPGLRSDRRRWPGSDTAGRCGRCAPGRREGQHRAPDHCRSCVSGVAGMAGQQVGVDAQQGSSSLPALFGWGCETGWRGRPGRTARAFSASSCSSCRAPAGIAQHHQRVLGALAARCGFGGCHVR